MSASRMKNLILLVLTLCALGLLCIVVPNRLAQTHEQRQMLQELKTLYEGYDLSIDLDELPRSPTLYIVELSEDGAQTAAQALLGAKTAPAGASGFESTYESDLGTLHITRTGGGVSAEGRNAPPSVRRRHRRRTHRRLGDGVSLICTCPRCTGAGAPERSQQVIAKSDSPMRIRRLFAVNRRGRCPHRPGRTHRFCGNLRRIRNFPAGRCGHRPLQTSG